MTILVCQIRYYDSTQQQIRIYVIIEQDWDNFYFLEAENNLEQTWNMSIIASWADLTLSPLILSLISCLLLGTIALQYRRFTIWISMLLECLCFGQCSWSWHKRHIWTLLKINYKFNLQHCKEYKLLWQTLSSDGGPTRLRLISIVLRTGINTLGWISKYIHQDQSVVGWLALWS